MFKILARFWWVFLVPCAVSTTWVLGGESIYKMFGLPMYRWTEDLCWFGLSQLMIMGPVGPLITVWFMIWLVSRIVSYIEARSA
jgi:hypothetical protein